MVEPTESEDVEEIDRFIDAMLVIREEIAAVERGEIAADASPLRNAPHTVDMVVSDDWAQAYPREQAAFPVAGLRQDKYFSPVRRVDNAYGDRNLVCACPPLEDYED
jgi:glycine dehydrogenase